MKTLSVEELSDLYGRVQDLMEDSLLPALTKANRTGDLDQLLVLLGMSELLGEDGEADLRPKRLLVLGDSMVKVSKLQSIARKNGWDPDLIDFELGYDSLKHFQFESLRYSDKYCAILVGPIPHSTPGKRNAGSAIEEMARRPEEFPRIVRLEDSTGLKITNNSFARAIVEVRAA